MATGVTAKTNVFIPEVAQGMISAGLPKLLKFAPIAAIDNSLQGQAGDTVTIPAYGYIGSAKDLAEGAAVEVTQMSVTTKKMPIKKVAKAVTLTDEVKNSALGDPVGETVKQLALSIADKIDDDVITALASTTLKVDKQAKAISYDGIVEAVDKLAEETATEKVLFVAPEQIGKLRTDETFIDKTKYGADVVMTGEIGQIAGCRVVVSRKVKEEGGKFKNYIVALTPETEDGTPALPAVTIFKKTEPNVEAQRDTLKFSDNIAVSQHYGVGLTNESKVVEVTFKK